MLARYSSKFKRDSKELVRKCNSLQEEAERHEELEEEMEASHQQMEKYKKLISEIFQSTQQYTLHTRPAAPSPGKIY